MLFQNAGATAIRLQGSGYTIVDCWFENDSITGNDILMLGGYHRILRNIGFRKSIGLGTEITVNITSALTADRNCTLATTNAVVGRTRVRVLNNSAGGHNVNVQVGSTTLRTLAPGAVGYFMFAPGSTYVVAA